MRFEDKPIEKENFLPPRKRPYNPNPPKKDCYLPPLKGESSEYRNPDVLLSTGKGYIQGAPGAVTGIHVDSTSTRPNSAPNPHNVPSNPNYQDEGFDEDDKKLYCICKEPYNPNIWMIGCDTCQNWFHGKCVGITAIEARKIKNYVCAECVKKGHGNNIKPVPTNAPNAKKPNPQQVAPLVQEKKRPIDQVAAFEEKRKKKVTNVVPQIGCKICLKSNPEKMLLCERCRSGFHASCLKVDPMTKSFVCQYCRTPEEKKVSVSTFWPTEPKVEVKVEPKGEEKKEFVQQVVVVVQAQPMVAPVDEIKVNKEENQPIAPVQKVEKM